MDQSLILTNITSSADSKKKVTVYSYMHGKCFKEENFCGCAHKTYYSLENFCGASGLGCHVLYTDHNSREKLSRLVKKPHLEAFAVYSSI